MSPFWKSYTKTTPHVALVFDIGSGSIAGALVVLKNDAPPHILYGVRKPIPFQAQLDFERFTTSMYETFRLVVENVRQKGFVYLNTEKISEDASISVLCMYASPWYEAHTQILTLKKEQVFSIDQNLIERLVGQIEEDTDQTDIIEKSITGIKVNGYSVDSVKNKEGKHLELTVSHTTLPHHIANEIESTLRGSIKLKRVIHHSFPLAAFSAIRDVFHEKDDFMVLDFSAEVTDLSLVQQGAIIETVSFPIGKNSIIRGLKDSPAEAASVIRMKPMINALPEQEKNVNNMQGKWIQEFTNALESIEKDTALPNHLFYIADKDFMSTIAGFLDSSNTSGMLEYKPINYDVLHKKVAFSHADRDMFLGVGALFVNKVLSV